MRIAVVGAGIAGLGAAYALSPDHEVHVFERDGRFGGHANTVEASVNGRRIAVDTGFIVYNTANYPNLTGLFAHLGVPTHWSDMSFGLSLDRGRTEYACDDLNRVFAQRTNVLRPAFVLGMREILRFNRIAPGQMDAGGLDGLSLRDWLAREGFSGWFRDNFILPMGGAIWSTPAADILDFPALNFVSFFRNHDLMTGLGSARRWRTVTGGSRKYVARLVAAMRGRLHSGAEVTRVRRSGAGPVLRLAGGHEVAFDQVILACHAPQALALLDGADPQERAILSAFRTFDNLAVLHSDPALMPRRRRVWSSWNFLAESGGAARPAPVTYWMNRLQGIDPACPLFVSLNPVRAPRADLVHATFSYAHPLYDAAAFAAQRDIAAIQGRGGMWYAGAWLGYGFHEDGLRSGLRAAASLGAAPGWAPAMPEPWQTPLAEAAE
jgi:predicted NAD/FAD-binding protein